MKNFFLAVMLLVTVSAVANDGKEYVTAIMPEGPMTFLVYETEDFISFYNPGNEWIIKSFNKNEIASVPDGATVVPFFDEASGSWFPCYVEYNKRRETYTLFSLRNEDKGKDVVLAVYIAETAEDRVVADILNR